MSKAESTSRLNVEENFTANAQSRPFFLIDQKDDQCFLSPQLQKLRALLPQNYLLPRTYGADNPFNKILLQANQSSAITIKTVTFFSLSTAIHQQEQTNKRKTSGSNFLSVVNTSDAELDMEASLNIDIPSAQLDAMIQELYSDFCEPAQKKIKIEPLGP